MTEHAATRTSGSHALRAAVCAGASAVLAVALPAAPSAAVEWRSTPGISMTTGYDDNIRLEPVDAVGVANASVTVSADISARDEGFELGFTPQVRSMRYDDDSQADRNDAFATLSAAWSRERDQWSLGGRYAHESTLTSGFEDLGLLIGDTDRIESGLNAGWGRRAGDRGSLSVALSATDVNYDEAVQSSYTDYRYDVVQASYSRVTSTRSSWRFTVMQSVVNVDATGTENRSTSVSAGWTHTFSPELTATVSLGAFDVEVDRPFDVPVLDELGDEGPTPSLDFSVQRRFERWTFAAVGARDLRPDGRGQLVREDSVGLTAERRVTQKFSVGASLRAVRTTDGALPDFLAVRDYGQSGVRAQWTFGPQWWLSLSVEERQQEAWWWPRSSGVASIVSAGYRGR